MLDENIESEPQVEETSEDEDPLKREALSVATPKVIKRNFVMTEARAETLRKGREKRAENVKRLQALKKAEKEKAQQLREMSKIPEVQHPPNYRITFL